MIFVSQDKRVPRYEARPVAVGWAVYEDARMMADALDEADAKAIAQALNFQRLMVTVHPLSIVPPAAPELN